MSHLEDYTQRKEVFEKKLVTDYQKNKGLPGDNEEILSSDELFMHQKEKIENTSFADRTDYYFRDQGYYEAKVIRYRKLASKEKKPELEAYAARYKNQDADKVI